MKAPNRLISVIGTLLFVGSQLIGNAEPRVGDKAPAFKLKGSDGKTHALSDFEGKQAVVVAWFPKAFTGG